MARLKIEAELDGIGVVSVEKALPIEADPVCRGWAEAAYPGTEDAPLTGAASVDAAARAIMQGVLDNINRHALERARAEAEANAPRLTA